MQYSVYLLGSMRVLAEGQEIDSAFRTKKERALLAYLAVEADRQHRREALAELLWPGRPEGYARTNLRQAMLGLRKALGGEVLSGVDEYLRFGVQGQTWLDTQAFLGLIQSVQRHPHRSLESCELCARKLEEAIALYRGDFLEDMLLADSQPYQEWVVYHREQYFRHLLSAYGTLSDFYQLQGDYERSYRYAWQHVNAAPLEEAAHRQLMNLLALSGRRSAALEQYLTVREVLRKELGVDPSRETSDLYERIRTGAALDIEPAILNLQLTNLPAELTSFVGREKEIERLRECLANPECRLITLVGMAGAGKTRLAVHAASAALDRYADGVWLVPVDDLSTLKALAGRIAQSIGLPYNENDDPRPQLQRLLRPLQALLILDGFERLVDTTGVLVELLTQSPNLKLLVTSRRRLNYQSACFFDMYGLPYPRDAHTDRPMEYPAVQLFMARAQHNRAPVPAEPEALFKVAQICQLLEGLPLGIELAAAALREQPLDLLLEGVQGGLDALAASLKDLPGQHQSMRSALEPSWNLLTEDEKGVYKKLSVFPGDFTVEAAAAVAGASPSLLSSLLDHSLLRQAGVGRYQLGELLRHYATEKLAQSPAEQSLASDHVRRQLRRLSTIDPVTSLPNRELFWDRLEHTLARASRNKHASAVLVLEVALPRRTDTASLVSEERLMRRVGQTLAGRLRRADTVGYLERGRFGIILDELAQASDARSVADKMLRAVQELLHNEPGVRSSFSMAVYPLDGEDADHLLARAEAGLS